MDGAPETDVTPAAFEIRGHRFARSSRYDASKGMRRERLLQERCNEASRGRGCAGLSHVEVSVQKEQSGCAKSEEFQQVNPSRLRNEENE